MRRYGCSGSACVSDGGMLAKNNNKEWVKHPCLKEAYMIKAMEKTPFQVFECTAEDGHTTVAKADRGRVLSSGLFSTA